MKESSFHQNEIEEGMKVATYKEIQNYVKQEFGFSIKTCWIADMKEKCGIPVRKAPNRIDSENRENQCPKSKEYAILDAFKYLGMY